MIVFLSPSKTFKNSQTRGHSMPLFMNKTNLLLDKLKDLNIEALMRTFKISNALAKDVYTYYQTPYYGRAINLYDGTSYKAFNGELLNFTNNKLYIVSALYGLVRPDDDIQKYRLDFMVKGFINLRTFWSKDIGNYLKQHHGNEALINLCSDEFSWVFKNFQNTITIKFVASDDKRLSSVLLKKLRGLTANQIISKNLKSIEQIKRLNILDFTFNKNLSSDCEYYFVK